MGCTRGRPLLLAELHVANLVGVFDQFGMRLEAQRNQDHLNAFPASELHCRNEIAVGRDQRDTLHDAPACQPCDVEADLDGQPASVGFRAG